MIIKSLSRKAPTFAQLAGYIDRGSTSTGSASTGSRAFGHNLYHESADAALVAKQFSANHGYLPKRANGNALYHEVIALEPQGHLPPTTQVDALERLARHYVELRAPHQLAWGKVHLDSDYPHIHLMISANAVRSNRRVRLTTKQFTQTQHDMERFKAEELPELIDRVVYKQRDGARTNPKVKSSEGEMVSRTGKPSAKQLLTDQLRTLLAEAKGRDDLDQRLTAAGLTLYQRGKTVGVIDAAGRKHRLSTLGLANDFAQLDERRSAPAGEMRLAQLKREREAQQALNRSAQQLLDGFEPDHMAGDELERDDDR